MTILGEYEPASELLLDPPDYFDVRADYDCGVVATINGHIRFGVTANQARLLALELMKRADESDYLARMEQITPMDIDIPPYEGVK